MAIKQLSVFIPNQKGTLASLTTIFYERQIDIRAISVYDTAEYGILRAVVDKPDEAVAALKEQGLVAKLSNVLCVNPEDEKGSLSRIFTLLGDSGINIDYIYSFVVRKDDDQYFVLKVDDLPKAEALLEEKSIKVVKEL